MSSQPVSAYWLRVSSSHVRPPARVYGVYCVKSRTTCLPGGATVGSRLEGMTISIIGLKQCTAQYLINPHFNFKQYNCPMTFVMDPKEHLYKRMDKLCAYIHIHDIHVYASVSPHGIHISSEQRSGFWIQNIAKRTRYFSWYQYKATPPPTHTHTCKYTKACRHPSVFICPHTDTITCPLSTLVQIPHTCSHADNISLIQTPLCLPYLPSCQHPCISLIKITLHLLSCRLTYISLVQKPLCLPYPPSCQHLCISLIEITQHLLSCRLTYISLIQKPHHLPHLPSCKLPQVSLIYPNGHYPTSPLSILMETTGIPHISLIYSNGDHPTSPSSVLLETTPHLPHLP